MNKNLIIILSAVAAVLVIGGIIFFVFLQPSAPSGGAPSFSIFGRLPVIGGREGAVPPVTPPAPLTAATTTPSAPGATGQLMQITDEPVIGPMFDSKTKKLLYYKKTDGHLVANPLNGEPEETISNLTILNILEVRWSPEKNKVIILYQDGDTVKKFVSEATSTPKVIFLPQDSVSPAWSPDGKSLWWLQKQGQTYSLVSADTSAKNQKRRGFSTPIPDLQLSLLDRDMALLIPKTASRAETPLFLFNARTQTSTTVLTDFGLTATGGPGSKTQNIIYASTNRLGAMQNMRLLDLKNAKDTSWPLPTLAAKCSFSPDSKVIFCAVPQSPPKKDLPEAWFQGTLSFSDAFYKIDVATGKAEEIYHDGNYDAVNLTVSDDVKKLFFIDKKTGFLYGLALE